MTANQFVMCLNIVEQQPAISTLREVEAFLTENPTEIVTIIIEDYVHTPNGIINLFTNAGLDKYWFPVSKMPKKGEDWPTVTEMVQDNHRLLVFTSVASKEAEEGVAYQWKYMVENERKPGVNSSFMYDCGSFCENFLYIGSRNGFSFQFFLPWKT